MSMYYSLEEAANRLGTTADQVRALMNAGELRVFRHGDEVMLRRDEIDRLAATAEEGAAGESDAYLVIDAQTSDEPTHDAMGLGPTPDESTVEAKASSSSDSAINVINVFDVDIEASGSGLLDLTTQKDDTTLGPELLVELHAESGSMSGELVATSSESLSASWSAGPAALTGLELQPGAMPSEPLPVSLEPWDAAEGAGSSMWLGLLVLPAALFALAVGLFIAIASVMRVPVTLVDDLAHAPTLATLIGVASAITLTALALDAWQNMPRTH